MARELADNPLARLEDDHFSPHVLRRMWDLADDRVSDGSSDSLRVARLCCRIAHHLESDEAHTRGFARLASALRMANRLAHAERAVEIALDFCTADVRGDVLRRRSIIRLYQGRLEEAQKDAEAALGKTSGIEHARALEASGAVFYYRGEYRAAIREFGHCLAEAQPDDLGYCNAIQNYASALAQGTEEEMQEALKLCAKARSMLTRRHRMQRAKLWWTEGLLHFRLGHRQRAWRALDTARRSLIGLEAAPEVAAVVADMARVSQQPNAIRQICREATGVLAGRHPLRRPLRALGRAARELIPEAAAALRREACTLAPCLAL